MPRRLLVLGSPVTGMAEAKRRLGAAEVTTIHVLDRFRTCEWWSRRPVPRNDCMSRRCYRE